MSSIKRRAFALQDLESAAAFCESHPLNFGGREQFMRTLTALVSDSSLVVDVFANGERVLFANVIDKLDHSGGPLVGVVVGANLTDAESWAQAGAIFISACEQCMRDLGNGFSEVHCTSLYR